MTWAEVKKEFISLAHLMELPLTEKRAESYFKMWADMEPDLVMEGLKRWSATTKVKRLPLPSEIRAEIQGEEAVGMILLAIRNFGYMRPEEAREDLGDLWRIVEMLGGWRRVCESEWTTTTTAQCRDLWNQIRSSNGASRRISGHSEPQDTVEGPKGRVVSLVRGIQKSQRPHKFDGFEDPPDEE